MMLDVLYMGFRFWSRIIYDYWLLLDRFSKWSLKGTKSHPSNDDSLDIWDRCLILSLKYKQMKIVSTKGQIDKQTHPLLKFTLMKGQLTMNWQIVLIIKSFLMFTPNLYVSIKPSADKCLEYILKTYKRYPYQIQRYDLIEQYFNKYQSKPTGWGTLVNSFRIDV